MVSVQALMSPNYKGNTMRKAIAGLAAVGGALALALPVAAQARTTTVNCGTWAHGFDISVQATNTSCKVARDVASYTGSHDAVFPFRVDGRTWRGLPGSPPDAYGHSHFAYASGNAVVRYTTALPTM